MFKNSLVAIHTFIDYSEWPSKYCPLEDRTVVGECGVWEPQLEASIHLYYTINYSPNHLFQFGETSNWLLIILQFLVPKKRKGCLISMLKSKISGIKLSIFFSFVCSHIIMIEDLTAIMKQYPQIVHVYAHFDHNNDRTSNFIVALDSTKAILFSHVIYPAILIVYSQIQTA